MCPSCGRLSLPPGIAKRLGGLALLVPFLLLLGTGLGTGVWLLVSMVLEGPFSGGFALIAVILLGGCGFGLRKTLGSLLRLLRPGGLLPLAQGDDTHRFEGDL